MQELQGRRRRAAAAGGGGGGHISLFSTAFLLFLLLPRDQVKGERGRRAGWERSASRRVAV
jgi:hypothetical protein